MGKFDVVYISSACNRTPHSADWGRNNLICYAASNSVAIYDPEVGTNQITRVYLFSIGKCIIFIYPPIVYSVFLQCIFITVILLCALLDVTFMNLRLVRFVFKRATGQKLLGRL